MKPTDILGNIKLYNADCMEVMKTFKDKQFELAICDPPYGIGIDGQKEDVKPVSYTHLDVYKRQLLFFIQLLFFHFTFVFK